MLQRIKHFLKKILPPPVKAFNREVERILTAIKGLYELVSSQNEKIALLNQKLDALSEQNKQLETKLSEQNRQLETKLSEQNRQLETKLSEQNRQLETKLSEQNRQLDTKLPEQNRQLDAKLSEQNKQLEVKLSEQSKLLEAKISEQGKQLGAQIDNTHNSAKKAMKYAAETTWAEIFNNTITGSTWLKNQAFSPGRWAVGYPALYVIYRVLNEFRPKRILELGLGQSTRMISQYAAAYTDVEHFVVEHDPEWISFFKNDFELSPNTEIRQLDRKFVPYKEADAVRVFKDFSETFAGRKFDFIFIDAPLGGDMKIYARIDILSLLPQCLSDSFVIMIDDCERSGEINTIGEIKSVLNESNVEYRIGSYEGNKKISLLCSKNIAFLTTM